MAIHPSIKQLEDIRERLATVEDPVALLEGIFAYSPVAFQIYRTDGHCVLVNQAFLDLFGSQPPPEYNVLEDDIAEAKGLLGLVRRAFAGETISAPPVWYDPRELKRIKVTEGRRCAMTSTFFPLRGRDGRVSHIAIVFEDVTAELVGREAAERARESAEASARQTLLLADAGKALTGSLDYEQTLKTVARLALPAFADYCLVDLGEPNGDVRRSASAHVDPQKERILDELCRRYPPQPGSPQPAAVAMRERRSVWHFDLDEALLAAYTLDEEHRALVRELDVSSYVAVPMVARGRIIGALTLGVAEPRRYSPNDVFFAEELASRAAIAIDNARLFAQLETARHEAEAANRAKDEFLAMLGHELRNPLAPIATAIQIIRLKHGEHPPIGQRELEVIERQVQHLVRLVDDLLDVSRIVRGKIELIRERLRVADIVTRAVEMASPLLEKRQHQLTLDVARDLWVDGDAARLAQVIANLLTNAARYTDPGGSIRVIVRRDQNQASVHVIDNGRGIDREMLERVFDRFVQIDRTTDRAEGGLGLGLTLARSLTLLHSGEIEAKSEGPGRGSEFVVRLPLASAPSEAGAADRAVEPQGPRQRVLVVDDNPDAALLIAELLNACGHEVAIAHDGAQALAQASRLKPNVALLDIGLPVMDGYELGRRLREQLGPSIRLVAVTGYGQARDRDRSREAGFVAHLVKPVDPRLLLTIVAGEPTAR